MTDWVCPVSANSCQPAKQSTTPIRRPKRDAAISPGDVGPQILVRCQVNFEVPPPHSLSCFQTAGMQEHAWQACLEFPPSETAAERPVSLTSPKRPCPNGTDSPSPLTFNSRPVSLPRICNCFDQAISRLHVHQGWAQRFVAHPGILGVASYLQAQSDRVAYAVTFRYSLPEVEKSWRPNNRFPFPYPSTRQRSTAENPVPRRIQSLLSGSISTSHPPRFLIVLIPAPGRMRNFPQPARRGQDNIVHLPRRSSSWLSVNYGPADEPSLGFIQRAMVLGSFSCDSRVVFLLSRQVGTGQPAHFPMRWSREITHLLLNPAARRPFPISTALSLSGR